MQGARMVGPGKTEITPSYSYIRFTNDGESEKMQDDFALQVARGVSERVDVRARYEMVRVEDETVHVLGAGPKLSLVPGRVAFYAPVGFAFGSDIESSETWQLQPTFLFTLPLSPQAELNTSAKAQVWLNGEDADNLLAFNVGLGLGPDLDLWAVRPEVGMLFNPGEDGVFWHFSLGFSRTVGGR